MHFGGAMFFTDYCARQGYSAPVDRRRQSGVSHQ
jgi:hypothetical protein